MKIVMMADIIQSRQIDNRRLIQDKLIKLLDVLNEAFEERLVAKVEIQGGDSVQGVFINPSDAFLFLRMLQLVMDPVKLRGAIGIGSLSYEDSRYSSNLLDGSAFHNARKAMDSLYGTSREAIVFNSTNKMKLMDSAINSYFEMYISIRQRYGLKLRQISLINEILDPISMNGKLSYNRGLDTPKRLMSISTAITDSMKDRPKANNRDISHFKYKDIYPKPSDFRGGLSLSSVFDQNKLSYTGSDFVQRGIQEDIGEIVSTSRQNIQRYFSNGVMEERHYSAIICGMMDDLIYE